MSRNVFEYGKFRYEYRLVSQNRKTLSLTVYPNMSIELKCPHGVSQQRIDAFLKKKWRWLHAQLFFFSKYAKKRYKREYVSGESFLYLGRQYQLIVRKGKNDQVTLLRGKLFIETIQDIRNGVYNKALLERWYRMKRSSVFQERLEEVSKKFDYDFIPRIHVRPMAKRWGSALVSGKKIVLNPVLIQSSKECIDYVITHELCHFKHRNHDKSFWNLLERKCPDWQRVKEKLETRHG